MDKDLQFKSMVLGVPYEDSDSDRRTEALKKAKEREQGFVKSEQNNEVIKKRLGYDLFKGGQ